MWICLSFKTYAIKLKEIDYGPDENMVEDHVIKRLGSLYLEKEGMDGKT